MATIRIKISREIDGNGKKRYFISRHYKFIWGFWKTFNDPNGDITYYDSMEVCEKYIKDTYIPSLKKKKIITDTIKVKEYNFKYYGDN